VTDTKPKAPAGLREAINTTQPQWNVPEPSRPSHLLGDDDPPPGRCLLSILVVGATTCLCSAIVALSALAGYGDELDEIQTKEANNREIAIGTQYALAIQNEEQGAVELARDRYIFIETEQPGYGDVQPRLTQIALVLSATPTPSPSPSPTPTQTVAPTEEASEAAATATPEISPIEEAFKEGEQAVLFGLYEEAIEWFDVVIALDPNYRRSEVDTMLVDALTAQAGIYFAGTNTDSNGLEGNQLARGVTFVERARGIWEANPSIFQQYQARINNVSFTAFVVNGYLTAQAYLAGGLRAEALVILQELYALPSNWGYAGVSISDLIVQAGGTP
jgi:tetratricopeptide (TPR) repeat protein